MQGVAGQLEGMGDEGRGVSREGPHAPGGAPDKDTRGFMGFPLRAMLVDADRCRTYAVCLSAVQVW